MKTWNIQLVGRDGQPPSVPLLMLRYILAWPLVLAGAALVWLAARYTGWPSMDMFIVAAPFMIFIWTWIDRDGQFLHDGSWARARATRPARQARASGK